MRFLPARLIGSGDPARWIFAGLTLFMGLCVAGFVATESPVTLLVPFGLLAAAVGFHDYRLLYLAIWAFIPFSIEIDLPGGFSTDFPAEPMMWLVCLLLPAFLFLRHRELTFQFVFHPLAVWLVIHFFWIIFTTATSEVPMVSLKYTLAKSWYLICFVLLPLWLIRDFAAYRKWAVVVFVPLVLSVIVVMVRHSTSGFSFSTINQAAFPIYRNHVDYACCLALFLPYMWFMRQWFGQTWVKRLIEFSMLIVVAGIYFSYTRAAWVCIPLAVVAYGLIRFRLMRAAIPLALAAGILITGWMAYENRYLEFSPDYEKAITHQKFDALVSATYKLEDISTVERFYRWVAGYYMVKERPLLGFGPSSFYSSYHSYIDRHFTTYVSDNPEHSGIHNYYLMTAVEQGLPGLVIFLILISLTLLIGESTWHRISDKKDRQLLMAGLISFVCNLFILTLNDTVETEKMGTFFFISIALVIFYNQQTKRAEP